MKAALLGGTFDPPHIGHMYLADVLIREAGYERVFFVPAYKPAHKNVKSNLSPRQRLEMLEYVLEGEAHFIPEPCEIKRGGTSYSIETVRYVKEHYSELKGNPGLVIGDDLIEGFSEWKESEKRTEEADIIVAKRESADPLDFPYPHTYLDNLIVPVSSTLIRKAVSDGRAFRYLVTERVYSYIVQNRLYVD
jgi:nicotinate-nucleotide adenylyltransferase